MTRGAGSIFKTVARWATESPLDKLTTDFGRIKRPTTMPGLPTCAEIYGLTGGQINFDSSRLVEEVIKHTVSKDHHNKN
ncbi:hypothetical protein I350_03079 [Cryptococcus amylolentus CBS 6273]|uniref:Uncharacterized protein n=1 Tax=Cryptococcus amylolentus CBS 6273 TaxID=1296118 RepID=A0A1E3K8Q4_9TREE|nr:hypothetical protein I350_03079 [Cryptococcus amylolentus CBS 6273]